MNKKWKDLEILLNELHTFPTVYVFKFIVPSNTEEEVLKFFPETKTVSIDKRSSQNGQYTALTLNVRVSSSNEICQYYIKLESIKGIISL